MKLSEKMSYSDRVLTLDFTRKKSTVPTEFMENQNSREWNRRRTYLVIKHETYFKL